MTKLSYGDTADGPTGETRLLEQEGETGLLEQEGETRLLEQEGAIQPWGLYQ